MAKRLVFNLLIPDPNEGDHHEPVQLEVRVSNAPLCDVSPKYDPPCAQEGDHQFTFFVVHDGENLLVGDQPPVCFPQGSIEGQLLTGDPYDLVINNFRTLIFALFAEAKTVLHESLDPLEWGCLEDVLINSLREATKHPPNRTVLKLTVQAAINNCSGCPQFSVELRQQCVDYREYIGLDISQDLEYNFGVPVTLNSQNFTVGADLPARIGLGDIMAWRMQPKKDMAHHLPVNMVRIVLIALRKMYKDSITVEQFDMFDRILQEVCGDRELV